MGFLALGVAGWIGLGVVAMAFVAFCALWDRGTRGAWEEAVEELGLEFTPHPQSHFDEFEPASGTYRGKGLSLSVRLRIQKDRSATRQISGMRRNHAVHKYYTVMEAELADGWPEDAPRIRSRGFGRRLLAFTGIGVGDHVIGDRDLDVRYKLEESPSPELAEFMQRRDVKPAFRALAALPGRVRIDQGVVRVEKRGRVVRPERLVERVDEFVDWLKAVDRVLGRQSSSTPMPGGGSGRPKVGRRIREWAADRK